MENSVSSAKVALLLASLEGVQKTRLLAVASCCLLIYDHIVSLDREIDFFWSGKWSITRILYFVNRYFPIVIVALGLVCLFYPNLSLEVCVAAIPTVYLLDVIAITVIQTILVIRCWYIFQNSPRSRFIVLFSYIGCATATFVILGFVWHELKPVYLPLPGIQWDGCMAPSSEHVWRVFVPGIVIHTLLYGATTIPVMRLKSQGKSSPIMDRVLRDGGAMYLVVFVTVLFSGIGAVSKDLNISTPAMYSNFLLAATSVSVSRLILSMQSLAANLSLDPKWLLNNAELSRVRWRKGSRDGELIVEVDVAEADETELELGAVSRAMDAQDAHRNSKADEARRSVLGPTVAIGEGNNVARGTKSGITTTKYQFYEDMPNLFYKGKGDTRP